MPAFSDRAQTLATALRGAGVDVNVTNAITLELWRKFVFLTTMAGLCGLAKGPIGAVPPPLSDGRW